MSCGRRIEGRMRSMHERYELADRIEDEGDYGLAHKVRRGDCLSLGEERRAKDALEVSGLHEHFDFDARDCPCDGDRW